jgi:hypothetical protein
MRKTTSAIIRFNKNISKQMTNAKQKSDPTSSDPTIKGL